MVEERVSPVTNKIATPGRRGAILHRNHIKRYVRSIQTNHVVLADGQLDRQGELELPLMPGPAGPQPTPEAEELMAKLTEEQRYQLTKLLEEFSSTFSDTPGTTNRLRW